MSAFKQALRSVTRKERVATGLHLGSGSALELWHSVQALVSTRHERTKAQVTFQQVITLGQKIAAATHAPQDAAREVVELLAKHSGSEVRAVALFTRKAGSGMTNLDCLSGLPLDRVKDVLSIHFDKLMDSAEDGKDVWGYTMNQSSLHNLKTFAIGMELNIPLLSDGKLLGGIWLGFATGATVLSAERREFVQAIAEHAASSLIAAQVGLKKVEETKKEKDFLLGISHDLRAPGNIALFALRDLLSDQSFSASSSQRSKLHVVEQSLNEQLDMLSDVLNYAKHKRGLLEPNRRKVTLSEVLARILENYARVARQLGLEFHVDEIPAVSLLVDHGHLQRIVSNYLSNAIKFTSNGSISVSFHAEAANLEIVVSDTGIGVPAKERSGIFVEFARSAQGLRKDGVGLGLALSKALAELNGGYVMYLPNKPEGSIFGVGVPLAPQQLLPWNTETQLESILVIDDDPATGRTLARYLKEICPVIDIAHNLEEAYSLIAARPPRLIVSDVWLGSENVESLLQHLKLEMKTLPVLLISGCMQALIASQLQYYPMEILEKPSSREQVLNAARRLIEASPLHFAAQSSSNATVG